MADRLKHGTRVRFRIPFMVEALGNVVQDHGREVLVRPSCGCFQTSVYAHRYLVPRDEVSEEMPS